MHHRLNLNPKAAASARNNTILCAVGLVVFLITFFLSVRWPEPQTPAPPRTRKVRAVHRPARPIRRTPAPAPPPEEVSPKGEDTHKEEEKPHDDGKQREEQGKPHTPVDKLDETVIKVKKPATDKPDAPVTEVPEEAKKPNDKAAEGGQKDHGANKVKDDAKKDEKDDKPAGKAEPDTDPSPVVHSPNVTRQHLDRFIRDPSFPGRCKRQPVEVDMAKCPGPVLPTTTTEPRLFGPLRKGATTEGMEVVPMDEVVSRLGAHAAYRRRNGSIAHHPIFDVYAGRTYDGPLVQDRLVEFNGVHSLYTYDCKGHVAAGDFRSYHQVRAAMCTEYEGLAKKEAPKQRGMFPIVDEEYFEYIMALTTAWQAAKERRPYVFIELGARYGTWIARAGQSYRLFHPDSPRSAAAAADGAESARGKLPLQLLGIEANCEWYRNMEEHIKCNHLGPYADLTMSFVAPRSYNEVRLGTPATYGKPRALSMLDVLPAYPVVDMMDFDIQGFEVIALEEPGAMALMAERVAFVHFGTHSTNIEYSLLHMFKKHGFVAVYHFAGAHHKRLSQGHLCATPYGPSVFNDGAMGFANVKFYPQLRRHADRAVPARRKTAHTCHWIPEALDLLKATVPGGKGPAADTQEDAGTQPKKKDVEAATDAPVAAKEAKDDEPAKKDKKDDGEAAGQELVPKKVHKAEKPAAKAETKEEAHGDV